MFYFLAFLFFLIAVNTYVTLEFKKVEMDDFRKKMRIAGIWIIPLLGAFTAWGEIRMWRYYTTRTIRLGPQFSQELADNMIGTSGAEPVLLEPFIQRENGLPVLDWKALDDLLEAPYFREEKESLQQDLKRNWLLLMRESLGVNYHVLETSEVLLLSSLEPHIAEATAKYVDTARKRIDVILNGLATPSTKEKHVVLVFEDEDTYYQYASIYYPSNGEFAISSGMFIDAGCPHFIVTRSELRDIEPVIAHELTHKAISHLQLPLWLDEGIAVNTEERLAGHRHSIYTPREMYDKHMQFWTAANIQEFWSGESFQRIDDGNLLSYDLARLLIQQFAKNWTEFCRFILHASREDAGANAAREVYDVNLGECICSILSVEYSAEWEPKLNAL